MGREILFIHFGQAGVQIGSALWELFCIEHRLSAQGALLTSEEETGISPFEHINCLFYEGLKAWTPRAVLVDLEPSVIDEVRCGAYRQLWKPNCLITGKEDAANNYGRGNCTIGKHKLEDTLDAIRKLCEDANNLAAFEIVHSHSGGTGSGMSSLIIDQLCDEYGKRFKFSSSVFPSSMYSQSTVDPYNSILHSHATIETLDCDILFDNQTMFERCTKNLGMCQPSFSEINRLLAQMLSSVFLSHRFIYHGSQHADTTELLTNLIPYPRIHFPSLFYAPIVPRNQMEHDSLTVQELTKAVFTEDAQTIDYPCRRNAYISCAMLYRGVSSPKQIYDALQVVKGTPSAGASFVDWCPTGFKVGLNVYPPVSFTHSPLAQSPRSICMLAGNLGMREAWHRNNMKFDVLFNRRCFVHWFIGEGIEESEFIEARDDLAYLEQDYTELMSETVQTGEPVTSHVKNMSEENENNPRLGGHLNNANSLGQQIYNKPGYPHVRQSNNANTNRHCVVTTAYKSRDTTCKLMGDYYGDVEGGDAYNPNDAGHSNYSNRSRPLRTNNYREVVNPIAARQTLENLAQADEEIWANAHHENHLYPCSVDHMYVGDKHSIQEGQLTPHETLRGYHERTWPMGDDQPLSGGRMSTESGLHTAEVSRNRVPRERNRNNARLSQTSTESAFLPTSPIIRQEVDPVGSLVEQTTGATDVGEGAGWSRISSQLSTHLADECGKHRRHGHRHHRSHRVPYGNALGQAQYTTSCWSLGSTSLSGISPQQARPRGPRYPTEAEPHRPNSRAEYGIQELYATTNGNIVYPHTCTRDLQQHIGLSCAPSISSGLGSASPDVSVATSAAHSCVDDGVNSSASIHTHHRTCSRVSSVDTFAEGSPHRSHRSHHHHHHHDHHHRRHHHRHRHAGKAETCSTQHSTMVVGPDGEPGRLETEIPNKWSISTENRSTTSGQSTPQPDCHYLSSSIVAKRPIYEVSIDSSPEDDERAPTPVLSAWSSAMNSNNLTQLSQK